MSTFDGIVEEFPFIRIDYFRKCPERPAPLACFLSHVHSDHLQGLESFRAPFIYCSPATRELLLRIEKFPHRMNFHRGILESRRLHYKHLAKLLRPIPLNTPTEIELTPRRRIKVTLFDANHCPGAVMFLVEGDGKAILYTGDIRAENWWVNSLVRNPVLIPYTYTLGQKRLDKLYLDTTFAAKTNPFREFHSKAEGLAELLQKVQAYPTDTTFYFRAWTLGYEDVWIALSSALNTKIQVDRYQMGLYRSLTTGTSEASALCGFQLGNRTMNGCLSSDASARVHSCEPGTSCPVAHDKTVHIVPVVSRTPGGAEIPEVGAGGGIGDLYQTHELELPDESALAELEKVFLEHITDQETLSQMRIKLLRGFHRKKALSLDAYGLTQEGEISLKSLVTALSHGPSEAPRGTLKPELPNTIRFPYSRHSSYSELCELVAAFRPKDIHPCTVDLAKWNENVSIRSLFGHLCSENKFSHDTQMRQTLKYQLIAPRATTRARYDVELSTQTSQETSSGIDDLDSGGADPSQQTEKQTEKQTENQTEKQNITYQSKETTMTKHNEIRRAHRYLHEHATLGLFEIGPLPSTWPTKSDGDFEVLHGGDENEGDQCIPMPKQHNADPSAAAMIPESDPSLVKSKATSEDTMSSYLTTAQSDSQQTDVSMLSISESAFDSPDREISNECPYQEDDLARSRRARVAAYRAARQDTFHAWTGVSMVSVDNHAEEEIEL